MGRWVKTPGKPNEETYECTLYRTEVVQTTPDMTEAAKQLPNSSRPYCQSNLGAQAAKWTFASLDGDATNGGERVTEVRSAHESRPHAVSGVPSMMA